MSTCKDLPALTVQVLQPSQVEEFRSLIQLFGEVFEEPRTYQRGSPDSYLQALLDKEHIVVIAAKREGQVVGGLVAYVLDKFEQVRREIYIYDLAVSEEFRRQKIATRMIQLLQSVGREKNAYVIFVQADQGDEPAIQLYRSLGIQENVHHFDIAIRD